MDNAEWSIDKKGKLGLRKLGPVEHKKIINYILPYKSNDLTLKETIILISEVFSLKFHISWKCMNLAKKKNEDITTVDSIVNNQCEGFPHA